MGFYHRLAAPARDRRRVDGPQERPQVIQVPPEARQAREILQQPVADQQVPDADPKGAALLAEAAVYRVCGPQSGQTFGGARPGAAAAMHAATAVGHGRGTAGAAGSGAGATARRGVGVAAWVAVAERTRLTLHGVLPPA